MKIPADAIVPLEKIRDYLLRPRVEDDKAAFLARAGYTADDPECLQRGIREQLLPLDAEELGAFDYGRKYLIRGILCGPSGVELRVVSIWATIATTGETRFITLYPDKP